MPTAATSDEAESVGRALDFHDFHMGWMPLASCIVPERRSGVSTARAALSGRPVMPPRTVFQVKAETS
jgi:hypothetical protein